MSTLRDSLPWTSSPLIVNAPMAGFAGGALASAVTLAGGLGLIGSAVDMDSLRKELRIASDSIASSHIDSPPGTFPVGVGFLAFIAKLEEALPVVADFKPAVVWLFAAKELDQYTEWAAALRKASPETKIWIQVGSVAAAVQIARTTKPDVLCIQGADAGGHGFEKGAGIISLLPEVSDTLAREGFSHIPLVASGGIVDGRGVAAALALGAQGVVMGTRFLAAEEVIIHPKYQAAVLQARDGGQVTARSKLFDQLRGPSIWPEAYDGRSLAIQSHKDFVSGVSLESLRTTYKEAVGAEDKGYDTDLRGRAAIWAGTGVGLVNNVESAAKVVQDVRAETMEILSRGAKL
ncbi:inosine monophosphate dehydrogenase [Ophiobolus disseminans]|uniref:Inosine monophosphate dehydrogenase n=1 Tax=Ophiobolus disseminans TaxID=1469910 RepID=A0A6A6ZRL3_9PLEO|nr:inosine monophosphate dehydrogenase [Ophiobolus disseminans]